MAELIGTNRKVIMRILNEMKNTGLITREGGSYGGHWKINKD